MPRSVAEGGLAPTPAPPAPQPADAVGESAAALAAASATPSAPVWRRDGDAVVLELAGERLARYEDGSRLPQVHAQRPYLHPVHTLAGTVLTDAAPVDHRHHYGVSLAVPDVNGTSHWGGRTYVRDVGPTLLKNHGRQASTGPLVGDADPHVLHDAVRWFDHHGAPQVEESRRLSAHVLASGEAWALSWRSVLRADHGAVTIGSPATNGRAGAGYGGWFWRLPAAASALVLSASGEGEEAAHESRSPWLAFVQEHEGATTRRLAVQHGQPRPWFVRASEYPGAGPSLAWDAPLEIPPGGTVEVGLTTVLLDRAVDAEEAAALAADAADLR
ncbi:PmoA family protein [Demequina litorisediminis]|uniref:DUF6807 domain-containing protein n=1 Tax=Demequina litorisediminis TaxID=1849022 RepID=UPI0024E10062|nr:PmoA family protein [Demequina litorisediminis]